MNDEIREKYPKAWNDFCQWWGINVKDYNDELEFMDIKFLFGYLVLEFFPKYGIEIERIAIPIKNHKKVIEFYLFVDGINHSNLLKSPEEAITKAFEILEKALEEK